MPSSTEITEAGWRRLDVARFVDHAGPVWHRATDAGVQYGLRVAEHHGNRSGFAHGGVLTFLLDTALGLTSSGAREGRTQATLGLDVQFLAPVRIGDFLIAEARVVKATRSIMFLQGSLRVEDRVCAVAQGTWKVLGE
jgi:uncharacterized protein (TIGR00369 family)